MNKNQTKKNNPPSDSTEVEEVELPLVNEVTIDLLPEDDEDEYNGTKFNLALHLAAGDGKLVGARSYIQFKKDYANVTNGDLVLHINMHDLKFPQEMIDEMNGYYISAIAFKHLWNKDIEYLDGKLVSVDGIEAPLISENEFHRIINPGEEGLTNNRFPDIEDYITNVGHEQKLKVFGMDGGSAQVFFNIFKNKHMRMTFCVNTADSYKIKSTFLGWTNSVAFLNPFLLTD